MESFVQEILQLNILAQDYHSDDDVLAISDSDSDILETVEKADFVEFLREDSSTLAGFEEDLPVRLRPLLNLVRRKYR
jgi:hypothetical protein